MGYSEASQAGIKRFGRSWRATIRGVPDILDELDAAYDREDQAAIEGGMRKIAALFATHFNEDEASFAHRDALEWLQYESVAYEMEAGTLYEWREEFNFRLHELYDWADYNRVWVAPDRAATAGGV